MQKSTRRRVPHQQIINQHFVGLEYVLDKYQHQNHILSKQVNLLIEQNKRLKMQARDYQSRHEPQPANTQQQTNPNAGRDVVKGENPLPAQRRTAMADVRSAVKTTFPGMRPTKSRYCQSVSDEDSCRTERIGDQKTRHAQPNCGRNYNNFNQQIQEGDINCGAEQQNQTQRFTSNHRAKVRVKTQILNSSRKKKSIKFTRQVYLEYETMMQESQSSEKLPTFVEASFGHADSKEQLRQYWERNKIEEKAYKLKTNEKYLNSNIKIQPRAKNKNRDSRLKQEKPELDKKTEKTRPIYMAQENSYQQKIRQQVKEQLKQKQLEELLQGKKTNQPYTKTEYKLAEPKTQLRQLSRQNKQNQEEVAALVPNKSQPKKTFISIMAKNTRHNIFR